MAQQRLPEAGCLQECEDAGTKLLDLICVDAQACGPRSQENSIETVCQRNTRRRGRGKIQRAPLASHLFLCNATS